jgi:hypothetical protein
MKPAVKKGDDRSDDDAFTVVESKFICDRKNRYGIAHMLNCPHDPNMHSRHCRGNAFTVSGDISNRQSHEIFGNLNGFAPVAAGWRIAGR